LVAATAGMPFRTAQRLVALYHQFGLTALVAEKTSGSRWAPVRVGQD
jgi:hypothetical protein